MDGLARYIELLKEHVYQNYKGMYREAGGAFKYPFLAPGSDQYLDELWDWDSWLTDVALRQILEDKADPDEKREAAKYEYGCILNFLEFGCLEGWLPISIRRTDTPERLKPENPFSQNMHKPVLAQHAAFLTHLDGDAEWLRDRFYYLQTFVNNNMAHHRHRCGLYYWQTDMCIGVDNDPCTFFRPPRSSGSIFLNCLMYKELKAMAYLCERLGLDEIAPTYEREAARLKESIKEHCWDERDGFYYSVDLNLLPNENVIGLHSGAPRHWDCLIMRIGVWSGFLALWAGIATPEQAERVVKEHYRNKATFNAPYGVRTLSKMEKMYRIQASGNPSCWLGPIWGVSNYLTFQGLWKYGYREDAIELAEKTVRLFGRDIERFGALHEYYQPENGEPVLNRGFQNWNYLVINMIARLEGRPCIEEF